MLGFVARRSLSAAAAEHMIVGALAARRDEPGAIAAQQLEGRVDEHHIQYSYAMPQDGGGMVAAPLSTDAKDEQESVISATMIPADLMARARRRIGIWTQSRQLFRTAACVFAVPSQWIWYYGVRKLRPEMASATRQDEL